LALKIRAKVNRRCRDLNHYATDPLSRNQLKIQATASDTYSVLPRRLNRLLSMRPRCAWNRA